MNYPPIIRIDADDNILQFKGLIETPKHYKAMRGINKNQPTLYVYRYVKSKTKLGAELLFTEEQLKKFILNLYRHEKQQNSR